MDERLERIEQQLIVIRETLAVNTHSLQEHMRRTDLLERRLDQQANDLKPVREHVIRVDAILKALGALAALAGVAASLIKVLEYIH
jgi:cob(I)alamin adenosyltransferase